MKRTGRGKWYCFHRNDLCYHRLCRAFCKQKGIAGTDREQGRKGNRFCYLKTTYLINNDTQSSSSKNKKAKELGIPILSEEDFLKLLQEKEKGEG